MWLQVTHLFQTLGRRCSVQVNTWVKTKACLARQQFMLHTRSLILSPCPRTEENNVRPDKIDLDIWKTVLRDTTTEASKQLPSEDLGDSSLAATRELIQMWQLAGKAVPENITDEQLKTFQELSTKSAKKKYLKYLAIKEGKKKATKEKQKLKQETRLLQKEVKGEEGAALKNTFLLQLWQRSFDLMYNWKAAQSMIFGQPLVFDMSYEHYMNRREMENTVSQLMQGEGCNRRSLDPFHLHFCNLSLDGGYHRELLKRYGDAWHNLLITATHESYIDIFPKDKLVYLTADSPFVLNTFQHDKVYIIGSIVDKSIQTGLSLANAKRLKLATARLPLDEYLNWNSGAKNLTLNQMINILLTVKETGNWHKALKFVPQRKHEGFLSVPSQQRYSSRIRKQHMSNNNEPEKKAKWQKSTSDANLRIRKQWWMDVD